MTSVSQAAQLPSQATSSTSSSAPPPPLSYASTAKKAVAAPPVATGSGAPSPAVANGGSAPAQQATSSTSSANGRPSAPAAPVASAPVVNSSAPNGGSSDHARAASVTYIANGGPVGGRPGGLSVKFGDISGSPAASHSTPQVVAGSAPIAISSNPRVPSPAQSPSPIPQHASTSGGRPPANISGPGSMAFGSLPGEGDHHMRQNATSAPLAPNSQPVAHNRQVSTNSNQSDMSNHGQAGRGNFGARGGRGGYNPTSNFVPGSMPGYPPNQQNFRQPPQITGRGAHAPAFNPARPPYSPHQVARSPALANAMPGTPNMNQGMPMQYNPQQHGGYNQQWQGPQQVQAHPFNNQAESFRSQPYTSQKSKSKSNKNWKQQNQSNRSREPSSDLYSHGHNQRSHRGELPNEQMPEGANGYSGPRRQRENSMSAEQLVTSWRADPNMIVAKPHQFSGQNHPFNGQTASFLQPTGPDFDLTGARILSSQFPNRAPVFPLFDSKIDLSPASGNFEQILTLSQKQNFQGFPPQYGPMGGMPNMGGPFAYSQMYNMPGMPPPSPQQAFQQPHYIPGQYGQSAQPMSRNGSQMSEARPTSSLGPQTPSVTPVTHAHTPQANKSVTQSPAVARPARKNAALVIKGPDGKPLDLKALKTPASPAPSNRTGTPPVSSAPTPPPKAATPSTPRPDSTPAASAKSADAVRKEIIEQVKKASDEAAAKAVEAKATEDATAESKAEAEEKNKVEAQAAEDAKAEEAKAAKAKEEADAAIAKAKADQDAADEKKAQDEAELDRAIAEMEAKEAEEEKKQAEITAKKNAEKAAKAEAEKAKATLGDDAQLQAQEREMERLEDEKEKKRLAAEGKKPETKEPAEKAASAPVTLASKLANVTNAAGIDSGASTPAADEGSMGPPKVPAEKRIKPSALNLAPLNTKPVEAPEPTPALKSLKSARFLTVLNIEYPEGISSPNPALNQAVTTKGKSFKYDKEFLLQFQKVFTEKPSMEFESQIKALIGDGGDGGSAARTGSTRSSAGGMGPRGSNRGQPGSFAMGQFGAGAIGGKTLPPGTTSAERFAASNSMPRVSSANPMASFARAGGAFPSGNAMSRTASSGSAMGSMPHSPRQQSNSTRGRGGSKRDGGYSGNPKNEQQNAKNMPLTAGMDLKPIAVTAGGWKPRSIGASQSATGAAGPAPGAAGGAGHMEPDMVQRKVKAALNKMTPEKFDKIADQILAIAAQSKDEADGRTLRQVIQLTFEKATDEAHWAGMYAKFCKRMLETMSPDIKDESILDKNGNIVSGGNLFRKYLLNRCQEEFERGWKMDLGAKPEEEGGEEKTEEAVMLSDEYYVAEAAKRRGLGLVQFIGELYKLSMLTERIMHECVKKLVDYNGIPDEAEIESLTKLLKTIGHNLDSTEKGRPLMDVYFGRIQSMIETPDLPSRLKFMLMDITDLRKKGWHSKDDNKGPKTLEEIKIETEAAAAKKAAENSRAPRGGGGGGGRAQMGRGDGRNYSNNQYGNQPPVDYNKNTVGMDDLRRLTSKTRTAGTNGPSNTFGPTSMFSSRSNSARKNGRAGEESGNSSRTGTPPQEKKSSVNAFSLLAGLNGESENPTSPPSAHASPILTKATPASEKKEGE